MSFRRGGELPKGERRANPEDVMSLETDAMSSVFLVQGKGGGKESQQKGKQGEETKEQRAHEGEERSSFIRSRLVLQWIG